MSNPITASTKTKPQDRSPLGEILTKLANDAPLADANGKAIWKGGVWFGVEPDGLAMWRRARHRERNRKRRGEKRGK